jgi:HSP20 family protein
MTDHVPHHEVELFREGEGYAVYVDLPGYDREDVTVRWHDGRLHVAAEQSTDGGTRTYSRHVSLPRPVDADRITATFDAASSKCTSRRPTTRRARGPRSRSPRGSETRLAGRGDPSRVPAGG